MTDPMTRPIDAIAGRTGLTHNAVAILFIVAGVLFILFPNLIQYVLGILFIIVGVVWLVTSNRDNKSDPPRV